MAFLPLAIRAGEEQIVRMFSDHCPRHGRRVLLSPGDVTAVHNGPDGVSLDWRCPCGGRGTYRARRRPRSTADAL